MNSITKALLLLLSLVLVAALLNCGGGDEGGGGGGGGGGGTTPPDTSPPTWDFPGSIGNYISFDSSSCNGDSEVATDSSGNTIIVWAQNDTNGKLQIFKAEYRNGDWTYPVADTDSISPDGSDAYSPRVAMDDNGNAMIVWNQKDQTTDCAGGSCSQIFKSEYRNGTWNHPALITNSISPDGSNAYSPRVAMDNNGNAVITWHQADQTTDCSGSDCGQIFKSEYRIGSWNHPVFITNSISPDGQDAGAPMVAMNDNGKAILAWGQYDGSTDCASSRPCRMVYMIEYNGSSWSTVSDLLNDHISPGGYDHFFKLPQGVWAAMDNNDNAVIVWMQASPEGVMIYRSIYNSSDWIHPGTLANAISPGFSYHSSPRVAMSDIGTAMIVWRGEDGTADCGGNSCEQIFVSFYNGTGWEDPADLNDNISPHGDHAGAHPAVFLDVDMDASGNAIVTWRQKDGTTDCPKSSCYQVFKAEYSSGTWDLPLGLSNSISPDGTHAWNPAVSMYGSGETVIVWAQDDGSGNYKLFKAEKR